MPSLNNWLTFLLWLLLLFYVNLVPPEPLTIAGLLMIIFAAMLGTIQMFVVNIKFNLLVSLLVVVLLTLQLFRLASGLNIGLTLGFFFSVWLLVK